MARVISETVPVREGQKTRNMSKLEAMLQAHTMKAVKGDARSASFIVGLVTRLGLLADANTGSFAALSEEDSAILEEYLNQIRAAESEAPDTSENDFCRCSLVQVYGSDRLSRLPRWGRKDFNSELIVGR
jgi:hypothetical protein